MFDGDDDEMIGWDDGEDGQEEAATPPSVVVTEARVWTTAGDYHRGRMVPGTEESTADTIRYMPFPADARVGNITIGVGRTINIGDFNSVRVDVRVSLPAMVEQLEDGSAAEHATNLANEYASQLVQGMDA